MPQAMTTPASAAARSDSEALDRAALDALPTVASGLAVYYALLTIAHALLLPPGVREWMIPIAAASTLALLGLGSLLRSGRIPPHAAHAVSGAVALVALGNCVAHLVLVPEPRHTVNLFLVVVASGALLVSRRWFAVVSVAAVTAFVLVDLLVPQMQTDWLHYALALGAATVVGLLTLLVRRAAVLRNAVLARELQQRGAELELALGDAERELVNRSLAEAELRRSRAALEESEERHRAVVENALDAIVTCDEGGVVTEFNPSAERIFGQSRERALGLPLEALLIPPELRASHRAGFQRFLDTRRSDVLGRRLEMPALRADGSRFPVELAVTAVELAGGVGFIGFMRDVTEAAETRAALARERGVLQAMTAAQTAYIAGGDSREAFEKLLLQSVAVASCESAWLVELAARGVSGLDLVTRAALWAGGDGSSAAASAEEELERLRPHLVASASGRDPVRETLGPADELLVVPLRSSAEPIGLLVLRGRRPALDAQAESLLRSVAQTFASLLEATRSERRRRRAEASLRESEERYRALSDHTLDLVLEIERRGTVLFASPSASEILGVAPSDLFGRMLREIVHEEDRPLVAAALDETFRTPGRPVELTLRVLHAEGGVRWLETAGRNYRTASGNPRLVLTARDVTARKEIERRLAEARHAEASIGARIQEALLLGKPPRNVEGLEIATLGLASDVVAGDFFDFLRPSAKQLDVVVGDVMGKGIPAALIGAGTKSALLRVFAEASAAGGAPPGPAALVAAVHRELTPRLLDLESFVTLAYARINLESRVLRLVDCGHTKPLHFVARSGACRVIEGSNLPVGILEREIHVETVVSFEPGDAFVFYSDGVTEAPGLDGDLFGAERLARVIETADGSEAGDVLDAVRGEVLEFTGSRDLADDLTCVVVRILDPEGDRVRGARCRRFSSDLEELEAIRAFVEEAAKRGSAGAISEERVAKLVLAANEAVSNVMRHAYGGRKDGTIEIEVEADSKRARVRILDEGPPFSPCAPTLPQAELFAEGGYGLYIIHEAVDEVRYRRTDDERNCVTLVQRADDPLTARLPRSETAS